MDRKFLCSGIFQFLDEVADGGLLPGYGAMIGKGILDFDEEVMSNRAELRNVMKRNGWSETRRDTMSW